MDEKLKANQAQVEKLINQFVELLDNLRKENPNWQENQDLRLQLLGLPLNRLISMLLAYKSITGDTLLNTEWWKNNIKWINSDNYQKQMDDYIANIKIAYFLLYFSSIEAQLRLLIRNIAHGACDNGLGPFAHIYSKILSNLNLNHHINTFNFARLLRNTIHNNGVYLDKYSKTDKQIDFRGITYTFQYGAAVNFTPIDIIMQIEEDLFFGIKDILISKTITQPAKM